MSAPSKMMFPDGGGISRISSRPSVDLPQPDLPTRPSVSPADAQRHVVHRAQRQGVAMQQAAGANREVLGQAGGLDQQCHA